MTRRSISASVGVWLTASFVAALASQAVLLTGPLVVGVPPVAGTFADLTLRLLPGEVAALIIDRLLFLAKPLLLVGLTMLQILLGTLAGLAVRSWVEGGPTAARRPTWPGAVVGGAALVLISSAAVLAAGDSDGPAATDAGSRIQTWGILLASYAVYAAALVALVAAFADQGDTALRSATGASDHDGGGRALSLRWRGWVQSDASAVTRRRLMGGVAAALAVVMVGGSLARIVGAMGERGSAAAEPGAPAQSSTTDLAEPSESRAATPVPRTTPASVDSSTVGPSPTPSGPLPTIEPPVSPTAGTLATVQPTSTSLVQAMPSATPGAIQTGPDSGTTPAPARPATPATPASRPVTIPSTVSPVVTPVENFYVVSKNFVDPTVDPTKWSLDVTGLVSRPLHLSFQDFLTLPSVSRYVTLECISNPVGGEQISNGLWTGVPFATLVSQTGASDQAKAVNFTCVDGYTESHVLTDLMDGSTILAHSLGGNLLTPKHGAPARLITLNRFGMKNPKWIQKIELAATPTRGYWERRGWSVDAIVKTMARIDAPSGRSIPLGKEIVVGGIAFAGNRGIARVEVSTDGGAAWTPAQLEKALASSTWVRWAFSWRPTRSGPTTIVARATDGTGALQPPDTTVSYPSGSEGYHQVSVQVG